MKKKNLLLLLSMSAFLVGCNDTPIVPDTSDTEIIELDNSYNPATDNKNGTKRADEAIVFPDIVNLHYHRDDNDYETKRLWLWSATTSLDKELTLTKEDDWSYVYTFSPEEVFKNRNDQDFRFLFKSAGSWSWKTADTIVPYSEYVAQENSDGKLQLDVWVVANKSLNTLYHSKEDALSDQIQTAFISSDYQKINIYSQDGTGNGEAIMTDLKIYKFTAAYENYSDDLKDGEKEKFLLFSATNINKTNFSVKFSKKLTINCKYQLEARFVDKPEKVAKYVISYDNLYSTSEFKKISYKGNDLGATVKDGKTTFKVWAPTATKMDLRIYDLGYNSSYLPEEDYNNSLKKAQCDNYTYYAMKLNLSTFVWECTINSDLSGKYYTYRVYNSAGVSEVVDPYAKSAGMDGKRGMVVDFTKDNVTPTGWNNLPTKWDGDPTLDIKTPQELVISENHIRDLTMSSTWGGDKDKAGTFEGFIQSGTTYRGSNGVTVKTGYDHLVEYGVNALQILPMFDHDNGERGKKEVVFKENGNETKALVTDYSDMGDFNRGYNPLNYNVVEGSYSSDPRDGSKRVYEFRDLVLKFANNENHTRIIMDVVYNHVSSAPNSNFEKLMPKYYFRFNSDGGYADASGCGNEVKTEAPMMRKFIVDSVCHWATNYKIKGFRFDLMGAIDLQTMSDIADALYDIDPDIVVYGEGWYAAAPQLAGSKLAVNQNLASKLYPGRDENAEYVGKGTVGGFNNGGRDALKGDNDINNAGAFSGFISSSAPNDSVIRRTKLMMLGANGYDACPFNPLQNINYVSCHDNYTLFDQLNWNLKKSTTLPADLTTVARASVAVNGMVLMSNGISFINGGEELFRTKIETSSEETTAEVNMFGNRITHNSYKSPDATNAYDYSRKALLKDYFDKYCELVRIKKDLKFSDQIVDINTWSSGDAVNIEAANTSNTTLGVYRQGVSGNYHVYLSASNSSATYATKGTIVFNGTFANLANGNSVSVKTPYSLIIVKE
ncbi:MAG: pullulanase-associated domain-containing protein [Candidatus Onthovivens sp.]|nr:pullulanase-associated domain-containing protein [Candidatus Onthovivens sp.]